MKSTGPLPALVGSTLIVAILITLLAHGG